MSSNFWLLVDLFFLTIDFRVILAEWCWLLVLLSSLLLTSPSCLGPLPRLIAGRGGRVAAHGGTLSSFIVKNIALDKTDDSNPREAILRHAKAASEDPYWVAPAYKKWAETPPPFVCLPVVNNWHAAQLNGPALMFFALISRRRKTSAIVCRCLSFRRLVSAVNI